MLRDGILVAMLSAGALAAPAAEDEPRQAAAATGGGARSPVAQESAQIFAQIEGMKRLPANGLQAVKAGGRLLYVTDNGRFVFQGPVYDLWNRTYLNSLEDVERYADHIDFRKMGLKLDDIALFTYGTGKQEAVLFVDPLCPHCANMLPKIKALKDQYRFRLVVVPLLGPRSQQASKNLSCYQGEAKDKGLELLLTADAKGMLAQPPPSECDTLTLQRALVTARMLGVYGVPYFVAPDGRTHQGEVADLATWLKGPKVALSDAGMQP